MAKNPKAFRLSDEAIKNLETITAMSGANETAAVEIGLAALANGLTKGLNMFTKDITQIYYCSAGGHFWRWDWTPEKGGDHFPAYVTDEEAPDDFDEQYCGCND